MLVPSNSFGVQGVYLGKMSFANSILVAFSYEEVTTRNCFTVTSEVWDTVADIPLNACIFMNGQIREVRDDSKPFKFALHPVVNSITVVADR